MRLLRHCEEALDFVKDAGMRSQIVCFAANKSLDFLFGKMLGHTLLLHNDNLSKSFQSQSMSAGEGQTVASMTIKTLHLL